MALTNNEINEILELYGRSYSGRKIADKTEHSPVTIYYHIHQARERVINLITEGMDTAQILSQLGYPDLFVNRVIRETDSNRLTNEKDESKVEELAEEIEVSNKVDVKADWADFKNKKELEQHRENIKKKAREQIYFVQDSGEYFKIEGVHDETYYKWQRDVQQELKDFVLVKVDNIDSIEAISELERISESIYKKISVFIKKYDDKVLVKREKKHSDQLLDKRINAPLFPEDVRDYIKRNFTVKNDSEASIVSRALFKWVFCKRIPGNDKQKRDALWQEFFLLLKQGKWEFLSNLASKYQERESFRKSPAV